MKSDILPTERVGMVVYLLMTQMAGSSIPRHRLAVLR
jgi:hypothetical protein